MKKDKIENKAVDPEECGHGYFNLIDGALYCSVCGKPADEVKQNKVETK